MGMLCHNGRTWTTFYPSGQLRSPESTAGTHHAVPEPISHRHKSHNEDKPIAHRSLRFPPRRRKIVL
ncbi:hypothetical protein BDR06DRAFT_962709 [Suillus hirtellus]|nr:hypothetical protein BDR06DRAFT_962709 [Suillus hirtellus]